MLDLIFPQPAAAEAAPVDPAENEDVRSTTE
jgi:hypothetical protein